MKTSLTPRKLFHVVVAGGISLAAQACSSDNSPQQDSGSDATKNDGPANDAMPGGDATMDTMSDACLNKPGDCTHGMCAW